MSCIHLMPNVSYILLSHIYDGKGIIQFKGLSSNIDTIILTRRVFERNEKNQKKKRENVRVQPALQFR